MVAGGSAREVARRRREKAERLARSADAWERGADGEEQVAEQLGRLPSGWTVLHDLPWPGRARANIDHLVLGPAGVFVIDAKNWSGSVTLRDGVLRQNGYRRESAVDSAEAAAKAVGKVLGREIPAPIPMLCFVGEETPRGNVRGVVVCGLADLDGRLGGYPHLLLDEQVARAGRSLMSLTRGAPNVDVPDVARERRTPRSRQVSAKRSRRRSTKGELVRFGLALAVALVLATNPEVVESAAAAFSELFMSSVAD